MKMDLHCHVKEGSIDSKVSMDEYITKPINIVELCKLLNHLIALHAKGA